MSSGLKVIGIFRQTSAGEKKRFMKLGEKVDVGQSKKIVHVLEVKRFVQSPDWACGEKTRTWVHTKGDGPGVSMEL